MQLLLQHAQEASAHLCLQDSYSTSSLFLLHPVVLIFLEKFSCVASLVSGCGLTCETVWLFYMIKIWPSLCHLGLN